MTYSHHITPCINSFRHIKDAEYNVANVINQNVSLMPWFLVYAWRERAVSYSSCWLTGCAVDVFVVENHPPQFAAIRR